MEKIKHVLGLSGGKDSSALALYMKEHYPEYEMEYFFTDTGYELDDTIEFIDQLEAKLGTTIHRLNEMSLNGIKGRGSLDFVELLKQKNNFLPSPLNRWCTADLKLKPFEKWVDGFIAEGYKVRSYVGIRADEPERTGFEATDTDKPIESIFPFREDGIRKADIKNILQSHGLDLPAYYEYRSRSGCKFCFYQRPIEWINFMERDPEGFAFAKHLEMGPDNLSPEGNRYYWMGKDKPLSTLEDPKRAQEIRDNHDAKKIQFYKKRRKNLLAVDENDNDMENLDEMYDDISAGCNACHR